MFKLQVTANKLNIRNSPRLDPDNNNWVGDMPNGETFNAVDIVEGDMVDGNNKWATDGINFVAAAGGGISFQNYVDARFNGTNVTSVIDYNILLNIENSLKEKKGENVTIAIVDHPIKSDITFENNLIRPFGVKSPAESHGSFIAGIIAGASNIAGIANNVRLIELPIYDEFGNQKELPAKALDYLEQNKDLMIVNISQKLLPSLGDALARLENKIIVASAGSDVKLENDLIFPANASNVIAVGAVSKDFPRSLAFNKKLDFIVPDFRYVSFSIEESGFESDQGDSYSCAVVSAVIALLFSSGRIDKGMDLSQIKHELSKVSTGYSNRNNFNLLNIINPLQ